MFKLLIIDDEIRICRLLEYMIEWEALGLEKTGFADNGEKALQLIDALNPDIVITDIRMPGYDGLEVIEKCSHRKKKIYFIIVSGYGQFEYAQKALQFGVVDYLLKPINQVALNNCLKKIINQINTSILPPINTMAVSSSNTTQLNVDFLEKLILNPDEITVYKNLQEIIDIYHLNFHTDYSFCLLAVQLLFDHEKLNQSTKHFLRIKTNDIVLDVIHDFHLILTYNLNNTIWFLLHAPQEDFSDFRRKLRKIDASIHVLESAVTPFHYTISYSSYKYSYLELSTAKQEVEQAFLHSIIAGINTIICYRDIPQCNIPTNQVLSTAFLKELSVCFETMNYDTLYSSMKSLISKLKLIENKNGAFLYDIYQEINQHFLLNMQYLSISVDSDQWTKHIQKRFVEFQSIDDAFLFLYQQFKIFLTEWQNQKKSANSEPIVLTKQYINAHYSEPLTLEAVGKQVGLNPSYLSSLFKKETQISFLEYISEVRISTAKQLLTGSSYSINNISEKVGFNDLKYFSKCFKKPLGFPSDYRKLFT